jgi:hypothetical protein
MTASAESAWDAIRMLTPRDLTITRTLIALRALPGALFGRGEAHPAAGLDGSRPLVEQFEEAGFRVLVEQRPRLLLAGAAGQPWRLGGGESFSPRTLRELREFGEPGFVKIALTFEVADSGVGVSVSTETRVEPTDTSAARAFGRYWTVIRLGSQVVRADMLRAVKRRCTGERGSATLR